tara:strand:+ start:307 stop:900 length:594 start_codon:yes stop_codon:yes gene_type:complete
MKEISNIIYKLIFLFFILVSFQAKGSILSVGQPDAKVTVKVFSSLTCPHCANFHTKIFYKLEKDFINEGKVKFEHHAFPLDLAALNAEIVVRCHVDNITKIKLLGKMYEKQKIWAVGSDINKINESIKKIGLEHNLNDVKMDECLKSEEAQDNVLNQRIEAQKKYKIDSTPTILINEKKYDGKIDYKQFKKAIEKNL